MSTIKPWGRVCMVGNSVGSFALGIGLRCRETVCDVVEKAANPSSEKYNFNRCVLSESSVRLLGDIGMTEGNLRRVLTPAKKWKFVTHALDVMKEGETYSGVAMSEACFHVPEGMLVRALRQDYSRFGGRIFWQSLAADPFPSGDESFRWSLKKEFGTLTDLEIVANFSSSNRERFNPKIFDTRQRIPHLLFNSTKGWTDQPPMELLGAFGKDFDVIMVLGKEVAMNLWRPNENVVAWQLVSHASPNPEKEERNAKNLQRAVEEFHPCLRTVMSAANSQKVAARHDVIQIPLARPLFMHEDENSTASDIHHTNRMLALGGTVIPIDAFGWRGDAASLAIQEASNMCSRMFATSRKYHRGDISKELREFELDTLDRRFRLSAHRDLKDAEQFLSVSPELPRDEDEEPIAAKVSE